MRYLGNSHLNSTFMKMIPVYLNVLLIIIVTHTSADKGPDDCPIGFTKVEDEPYCYRLKPPERYEDTYKDCIGNNHTLEVVDKLKLPKNVTLWTQYKSLYPGGPFDSVIYHVDPNVKGYVSNDVEYDGEVDLKEEYCLVISAHSSKLKAVKCQEGHHHRYCVVLTYSKLKVKYSDDSGSQCVGAEYERFFSPRATCLRLKTSVRTNWSNAQSAICESKHGSVLHRGWRLANALNPRISSWTFPLGMFMTSANTFLWSVEENGNTTVPESEYSFDDKRMHSDDQLYVAVHNNSWQFVNGTELFTNVVCEQVVQLPTPKLHLSITGKEILLKVVSEGNVVSKEDIYCYTDSIGWKIKPQKVTTKGSITDHVYKVAIYISGYYWCEIINTVFYNRVESERVLYLKDMHALETTYAVMLKRKNEYKFDDSERDITKEFMDQLKEYLRDENNEANVKIPTVMRLYLDKKTVLLRLEMDKTVKPVGRRMLDHTELIYIKPVYFCISNEANGTLLESVIANGKNYTCVGNFNDGVNWVIGAVEGDSETTTVAPTTDVFVSEATETTTNKPEDHIQHIINNISNMLNNSNPIHVGNVENVFNEADQFFEGGAEVEIPNQLLKLIDQLSDRVDLQGNNTVTAIANNIAMVVSENSANFHVKGLRVVTSNEGFVGDAFEVISTDQANSMAVNEETEAIVYLPDSVSEGIGRISFVVYRSGHPFRDDSAEEPFVNSKVFSIKVENVTQFQENEYVDIYFRPREEPGRNRTRRCMYWQFAENASGSWSDTGCELIEANSEGGLDICRCDHLTHFAEILMGRSVFSEADEKALEVISIIGCCFSIIGLAMVAVTAMLFRSWRRDFTNKIWLQLCISILILCICFLMVVFYRFDQYNVGCMLTGVALHYAVLASFCWMMIAAVLSYRRLVLVFTRDLSHKLLKAAAFCWGAPCVIIGILLAISPQSYGINMDEKKTTTGFCYPSGTAMWVTVYGPIALMLLINWTLFVLIVRSVFFSKNNTITSNRDNRDAFRCASVSCLLVLLFGLTWLFGLFADILAFAYLFNITSTFQGFLLFMFFIAGNKKTRDLWLNKLKIKQTQAIPVTSSTMMNKSTGQAWRSATTSGESNLSKPKSLSSPDNSRFS